MPKKEPVIILLIILLLSYFLPLPLHLHSMAGNIDTINKSFTFEAPVIDIKNNYSHVRLKNLPAYGEAGKPVLPFKTVRLLLPYGREVGDIQVSGKDKRTLNILHPVSHGQKYVPSGSTKWEYTSPNKKIYNSKQPFPGYLYQEAVVQRKMGYSILTINLYPMEYIPASKKASFYKEIIINVNTIPMSAINNNMQINHSEKARKEISEIIDNEEVLSTYNPSNELTINGESSTGFLLEQGSFLNPDKSYEYIIITSDELKNASASYTFQDLLEHRALYGIETDPNAIFTVEWIEATYDGSRPDGEDDLATKIRNFIIDAYNSWGTQYILLGGDADAVEGGDNIVPIRYLYVKEYDYLIPSDLYYACLDGTFDFNGNGL